MKLSVKHFREHGFLLLLIPPAVKKDRTLTMDPADRDVIAVLLKQNPKPGSPKNL